MRKTIDAPFGAKAAQPTLRVRRTFLNGALAVALAASLGAGTLGMAGCSNAGRTAQQEAPQAEQQGVEPAQDAADGAMQTSASTADATFAEVAAAFDLGKLDLDYSKRDKDASYDAASATKVALSEKGSTVDGTGARAEGNVVTISEEGTYVLSGTLSDGHVVVDAPDTAKVQVVLAGADIACSNGPALYVKSADKCFVTLADRSSNSLADGASYADDAEDEPYGALFSKDDLTINGTGSLSVTGSFENGIVSKDDLVITGGAIDVEAVADGIRGKDCVKIADGDISVKAGGDGIKSTNKSDAARGFVSIDGGDIAVESGDKAVKGKFLVRVAGGNLNLDAADDAIHSDLEVLMAGGNVAITAGDDAVHGETKLVVDDGVIDIASCVEGLEAQQVIVNGGEVSVEASDDALNAAVADLSDDDDPTSAASAQGAESQATPGGQMPQDGQMPEPPAGFDGSQMPEGQQPPEGFEPPAGQDGQMPEPPEGFDGSQAPRGQRGQMPDSQMPQGETGVVAQSDGQPADGQGRQFDGMNGQSVQGGRGGMMGGMGGMPESSEECLIQINGGTVVFNAGNDGLDSNGNVEINGGLVLGTGPSNGMDGALDYDLSATVNGGTFILLGSVGNTAGLSESTHPFVSAQVSGNAGDTVALTDADGTVIASMPAASASRAYLPPPTVCGQGRATGSSSATAPPT